MGAIRPCQGAGCGNLAVGVRALLRVGAAGGAWAPFDRLRANGIGKRAYDVGVGDAMGGWGWAGRQALLEVGWGSRCGGTGLSRKAPTLNFQRRRAGAHRGSQAGRFL